MDMSKNRILPKLNIFFPNTPKWLRNVPEKFYCCTAIPSYFFFMFSVTWFSPVLEAFNIIPTKSIIIFYLVIYLL